MTKHPAKFSDSIMRVLAQEIQARGIRRVLDPFAGTGRIHSLEVDAVTVGIEIEPEWAALHPLTQVGNALDLPFDSGSFDCIATSPTYGNRLADHHEAKDGSIRHSYTHDLGRKLHPANSGTMQWGMMYRDFHTWAWRESLRVLEDDGWFMLNVSDHIRAGQVIHVTDWHVDCLTGLGCELVKSIQIATPRMRFGKNADARVAHESLVILRKVKKWSRH